MAGSLVLILSRALTGYFDVVEFKGLIPSVFVRRVGRRNAIDLGSGEGALAPHSPVGRVV